MHAGKITYYPLSGDSITCKTDPIQTCMNNYELIIMICKFPMIRSTTRVLMLEECLAHFKLVYMLFFCVHNGGIFERVTAI